MSDLTTGNYAELLAENAKLREIAERLAADCIHDWHTYRPWCRYCKQKQPVGLTSVNHAPDCPVRQLAEMTR